MSGKTTQKSGKTSKGFTDEERAAMKERAKELKAEARRVDRQGGRGTRPAREDRRDAGGGSRLGRAAPCDRHANAPDLAPKTWYGQPAYARDGKIVCFFQAAAKFKADTRRSASTKRRTSRRRHVADLVRADEADPRRRTRIAALVKKAVS